MTSTQAATVTPITDAPKAAATRRSRASRAADKATTTRKTTSVTKAKSVTVTPVVITAAKGGDRRVAPRKGAIATAIEATGKSIQAIAREHGQNPSQLRRLAKDEVAKVDVIRAQAIATALGTDLASLFAEEPKAAPKAGE
jgi:lambda repressor-like predicted transcriptional regulator